MSRPVFARDSRYLHPGAEVDAQPERLPGFVPEGTTFLIFVTL